MGFFANLMGRSNTVYEGEEREKKVPGGISGIHSGMALDVEAQDGTVLLSGRVTGYADGDTALTLERQPGGLSFKVQKPGLPVLLRGFDEKMNQFVLQGTVKESTRLLCRLTDIKARPIPEKRHDFRLHMGTPASLCYVRGETVSNPEECILVDIGVAGACLESEFLYAEDDVLRLKIKLDAYAPMEFTGEIIRVSEYQPGKFRYGFLFAQLTEAEMTELTRTLYNIQVGNREPWTRKGPGHW